MHVYICMCFCVYAYIQTSISYMNMHAHMYIQTCMYVHTVTYIYLRTYIHICDTYMYMHVYICMYLIYTYTRRVGEIQQHMSIWTPLDTSRCLGGSRPWWPNSWKLPGHAWGALGQGSHSVRDEGSPNAVVDGMLPQKELVDLEGESLAELSCSTQGPFIAAGDCPAAAICWDEFQFQTCSEWGAPRNLNHLHIPEAPSVCLVETLWWQASFLK